jgi:uncharacterized protein YgbK (DUF1537 family)
MTGPILMASGRVPTMHKQQIFDLLRRSSAFLMFVSSFISALLSDASVVGCIIEEDGAVELTI